MPDFLPPNSTELEGAVDVEKIIFVPRLNRIVTASAGGKLRVYGSKAYEKQSDQQPVRERLLFSLDHDEPISALAWIGGDYVCSASASKLWIWDVEMEPDELEDGDGRIAYRRKTEGTVVGTTNIARIDEGSFITSAADGSLHIFHHGCGGIGGSVRCYAGRNQYAERNQHSGPITCLVAKNGLLVTGADGDGLKVWGLENEGKAENVASSLPGSDGKAHDLVIGCEIIVAIAKSQDSRAVVRVWDVGTYELLAEYVNTDLHSWDRSILGFDGRRLLLCSRGPGIGAEIGMMDIVTGRETSYVGMTGYSPSSAAMLDDGRIAIGFGSDTGGFLIPVRQAWFDFIRSISQHLCTPFEPMPCREIKRQLVVVKTSSRHSLAVEKESIVPDAKVDRPNVGVKRGVSGNDGKDSKRARVAALLPNWQVGGSPDTSDRDLPDFSKFEKNEITPEVVKPLRRSEIAELLAAFLVGFAREEKSYFLAAKASIEKALLGAGVFRGSFLVGEGAALSSDRFVGALIVQLSGDDLFTACTKICLTNFMKTLEKK